MWWEEGNFKELSPFHHDRRCRRQRSLCPGTSHSLASMGRTRDCPSPTHELHWVGAQSTRTTPYDLAEMH
jgi:hypothetical protein